MAKMTGQVYRYNRKKRAGIIITRDGQQYEFSMQDYLGKNGLYEGNLVAFEADGKKARKVKLLTGPAN